MIPAITLFRLEGSYLFAQSDIVSAVWSRGEPEKTHRASSVFIYPGGAEPGEARKRGRRGKKTLEVGASGRRGRVLLDDFPDRGVTPGSGGSGGRMSHRRSLSQSRLFEGSIKVPRQRDPRSEKQRRDSLIMLIKCHGSRRDCARPSGRGPTESCLLVGSWEVECTNFQVRADQRASSSR